MSQRQAKRKAQKINQRTIKHQTRKLNREQKDANIRAKYGPSKKPGLVKVKQLDTHTTIGIYDQDYFNSHSYAASLNHSAQQAGYNDYADYLTSSHWKRLREQVLARDRFHCCRCKSKRNLQVHHDAYDNLASLDITKLKTLCKYCHHSIHN